VRLSALLLCLVLAACGARTLPPPEGVAADDARLAPCRSEALNAPEVREIARRMPPPGYGDGRARALEDMRAAEQNAFTACLVREGVIERPAYGVERVRAPDFAPRPRTEPAAPVRTPLPPATTGY
jgi:hypothetical protein